MGNQNEKYILVIVHWSCELPKLDSMMAVKVLRSDRQ